MTGGRPGVSFHALVVEAWATSRARPVASSTTGLVIALVCLVTLATTGRTAATEQQVLATVDQLGTRLITVTDTTGSAGIDPDAVGVVAAVDGVEWAFGLGPASDVTLPGIGATRTGALLTGRAVHGGLPDELPRTGGRAPREGEAVAGAGAAAALGLLRGSGTADVAGRDVAVVGTFAAEGPLGVLDDTVLLRDGPASASVRYVYARAAPGYDVEAVAELVRAVVPSAEPAAVEVEIAQGALDLRAVLSGAMGESSRQLMVTVLAVGLLLVELTTTAAVTSRRRDFGRQRAMGASRSAIVALVVLQNVISGVLGAVVGIAAGTVLVGFASDQRLPWTFSASIVTLSLVVSVTGSVLPAVVAARRDPVRILRVP